MTDDRAAEFQTMARQMSQGQGFIAALDQSGGSTPKALALYGVPETAYASQDEMFDRIHEMRSRIATAPAFTGDKVIGAILFEKTMDREIEGKPSASYLWHDRGIVPFLKIDQGLMEARDGVRLMKPIEGLATLLDRAVGQRIFGTKERSVIDAANPAGIASNVAQQFDIAHQVLAKGLIPIIEPEVSIGIADKAEAETLLRAEIQMNLARLGRDQQVMLKLTLPETPGHYSPLVEDGRVLRVVALSGGHSRQEATAKLAQNPGVIASFSRALTEGLSADQTDADFNATLGRAIDDIHAASVA